jgi:hypothetical protein
MRDSGYSPEQIADAAACGYNPWEWVLVHQQEPRTTSVQVDPELEMIFENLVESAAAYYELTGRYLQIWGELGELYAEVVFGVKRHKPHVMGSDGKLGNDFIEIKTISPEKRGEQIQVKRAGNFNKLLVVKINESFEFEGRLLDRKQLSKGEGKHAKAFWSDLPSST